MSNVWSLDVDKILSVGLNLSKFGVNNWGLDKPSALAALDAFCNLGIPVLGGDVYIVDVGGIKTTYDNWYLDRNEGESRKQFMERSIHKAREYITQYQSMSEGVIFSIIPDIQ
jgi:Immunity protein 40